MRHFPIHLSLLYLNNIFLVFSVQVLCCFVRTSLFLRYGNGIDFIILFSDYSLPMYRNAIEFCMLIMYPAIFANPFISFNRFYVRIPQSFLQTKSSYLQIEIVLLLHFQSGCLLFLPLPNCSDETILLNRSDQSRYHLLF